MDLRELHAAIDHVDDELFDALNRRKDLIEQVAKYKKEYGMPIRNPIREQEIIDRLEKKNEKTAWAGLKLFYGILIDLNKFSQYRVWPKNVDIPTRLGGASVRAVLPDRPGALCRYISPLSAAEISISNIHSQTLPGGKILVDIELIGDGSDLDFAAAVSVLADTAEKFTLL